MIDVTLIPVLNDNYTYLLKADNGDMALVDPGEAAPVLKALEHENVPESLLIFNTHHHGDHIAGNEEIRARYPAKLAGPKSEKNRIAGMDILLEEGSVFPFGGEEAHILETPGHTRGSICIHFPESRLLFTGDTLFSMGCGRVFEGTPEQMWHSLEKIAALPDETQIFCGHEYTLDNGEFCLRIEPDNAALQERVQAVRALRAHNRPTLPVTLGIEKDTNAFLRAGSAEEFAKIRALKNMS